MNVVMLDVGGLEVAVRADEVLRFDDAERQAHLVAGASIPFLRARVAALGSDAIRELPALLAGLRERVGAQGVVVLDERALLLITPDDEQAARVAQTVEARP